MQLAPNGSILEGVVERLTPESGGFGCELVLDVKSVKPVKGADDFLRAAKGDLVRLFLAEPGNVQVGGRYRLQTTVLGGPNGERTVVESIGPVAAARPRRTKR
ncbi:MAG: hypothetical protein ACREBO_12700 [Novosphingobium sp.]